MPHSSQGKSLALLPRKPRSIWPTAYLIECSLPSFSTLVALTFLLALANKVEAWAAAKIPPTIVTQPASVAALAGSSVTFRVQATGELPFEYQWLRNGVPIPGAISSIFGFVHAWSEDAGNYQVVVRNAYGTVTSAVASLTIVAPLQFTQDPKSQVAKAGADVIFSVQASSNLPLNYLWYKDSNPIPGSTSTVLTLKNVQESDAGSYTAVAYTTAGGLRSLPATLTISGVLPPLITTQPVSQSKLVGTNASFFVQAIGGMPFSYQWFKNGLIISNAGRSNLTLNLVQESDAGNYHCVITNGAGSATSVSASLVVQVPPLITVQPTNTVVFAGTTVTFTAEAKGVPSPAYRWFKNGLAVPNGLSPSLFLVNAQPSDNGDYYVAVTNLVGAVTSQVANLTVHVPARIKTQPVSQSVVIGGKAQFKVEVDGEPPVAFQWFKETDLLPAATNTALIISNTQPSDAGTYTFVVSNAFDRVVSAPAILTVNPPLTIIRQPINQAVMIGSNATFSVAATAFDGGAVSYQWFKDDVLIPAARVADLKLLRVQTTDAGNYQARLFTLAGTATSEVARLTVNVPATIRSQPQSQTVPVRTKVRFIADIIGSSPLSIAWFKDGVTIPNATGTVLDLDIAHYVEPANYWFFVTNPFGSATSMVARLTVNSPPEITIQPRSQTNLIGTTTSFLVEAVGNSPLSYRWLKDGQPVVGATNWFLVLQNLQLPDAGTYRVVVGNAFGNSESAAARLSVGFPVSISLQPVSRAVRIGDSVTFAIASESAPPLNFQWFKDGEKIVGATNATLTVAAVKVSDIGRYAAAVNNPFGQARSVDAILSIRSTLTVKGDFDRDGSPDLVFQDQSDSLASWFMIGPNMISAGLLEPSDTGSAGWKIVTTGDFDGDGNQDLVLQHQNGGLAAWLMRGRQLRSQVLIAVDLAGIEEWKVVGSTDFNHDDRPDLLVQDRSGRLAAWLIENLHVASTTLLNLGNPVDLDWSVVGVDDFNEDGRPDIVFQHKNGTLAVWYLDGFSTASAALLSPSHPGDSEWRVVDVADRNGDGKPDLVFQHQKDGALAMWLLDGLKLSQPLLLNPVRPGGTWRVVAP